MCVLHLGQTNKPTQLHYVVSTYAQHLHHHKQFRTKYIIIIYYNNNNNRIERRNSRFFAISSLCREPSPTLKWPECNRVQITCNTSSPYHVQHVLRATWNEGTAKLLSLTEFKSHVFELYFIG